MPQIASSSIDPVRESELPDLVATEALARRLAAVARVGDVIAVSGGLGAGKTAFARAFIRARAGDESALEVPSPTFTLVQVYELPTAPVWHFDLYRLVDPEDAWEIGLEEALAEAITLIEWPERLGPLLPVERLDVALLSGRSANSRRVRVAGHGERGRRLAEALANG
ncbi:MAG TPA: tRNA (adenosine(37)-N6)-threonylcarbamoyltransferase complex ATPase subunit type 1 TsaE [Alphaproteobacteria bacterium]|nr:tRNA (adenosine(37)-N6)-threonylcarbamoyltransferase complex ATPase subunit type 1 TsaE [Alphaproteobacteria bacterium]